MARRLIAVLACLAAWRAAAGDRWYVDNGSGNDEHDGRSARTALASIAKAVAKAGTGDTIVLADTGVPYREPIRLRRLGGTPAAPFVIEGNGATITGLRPLPTKQWTKRDDGMWFHPVARKPYGFPFLVHRRRRVPKARSADAVEPGQHFWAKEGIVFRPEKGKTLEAYALEATLGVSGFEVAGSSYITCRNLVSEFHSNDGFNVHGDCRGIVCESVEGRHNGDDGFSIHEVIGAVVRNGYFHHNRWGIQDVNGSRSAFNGVTCEHNEINGANFVGGYHSLADCIVRDNGREQIAVTGGSAKHLVGSEHNPLCRGLVFLQNVVATGGTGGLSVSNGAQATAWNCIFARSETGVFVNRDSTCHLAMSIITDCSKHELVSRSAAFFRDHNLYHPGRCRWLDKDYGPEQWDAFRAAAGHDGGSQLARPRLMGDGTWGLLPDSPALKHRPRIGPTAPVRGYQAAMSGWSPAVGGLRCRLVAERNRVPMGAGAVFDLHFRVDPHDLEPGVDALNRFLHPRCVTLIFTDREVGETAARRPDGGVPELPLHPRPEDFTALRSQGGGPQRLRVRLLTSAGQQLAPGRYTVVATYVNNGRNGRDACKGPGKLWAGTLQTPPIPFTVLHAEPEEIEVRFHSALALRRVGDQIGYAWSEESPRRLRLVRRPGFLLGTRYETHVFVDGKEIAEGGGGLGGGTRLGGGESFLDKGSAKYLAEGKTVRIRKDVRIFETSVPAGHMWHPEGGDCRVLWKGSVEGTLTAPIKEGKP